jgi:predicted nucleic acid-binding protein
VHYSTPHYIDACVAVKVVTKEAGSEIITDYIRKNHAYHFHITEFAFYETLSVLKRKWLKKALTDDQYTAAVFVLESYIDEGLLSIDSEFRPDQKQIFCALRDLVKQHGIDFADALQIYTVLNGKWRHTVDECTTVFVTADKALANAAKAEGLRTWHFPDRAPL